MLTIFKGVCKQVGLWTHTQALLLEGVLQSNILIKFLNVCGREECTGCELLIESQTLQIVLPCCKRSEKDE